MDNTKTSQKYYIVAEDILPSAILKTAEAKEMLARGEVETVHEAVEKVGLSRSAFYKYKDGVFPFFRAVRDKIITIALLLEHRKGVLSTVLNTIAAEQGSILTIHQGIPLQGVANVTLSIETAGMVVSVDTLLQSLGLIKGVKKVELIGQE
ncbi:amino acid-binding ACT protein [Thermincola ferriacetica]|uniref:UPF0735 ACT domain-containing protein TherJR_2115 n=2 Tax=Thermincola TaxID=278993 RepID=D5X8T4_THEPJ|nr:MULTISPECIES: ACT domain-containing protein [Thermincola]ADG82960.1 amino acid-binding ACT domain protein [Thermincola potens JR]KNZ68570.1 amino acid-binding ACT protein [Thermincola ferriacetica]